MGIGVCGGPVLLWVHAHRMARDILTSLLILLPMLPLVILNSLNDYLCPSCNICLLLIYRDPGHLNRKEVTILDVPDDDTENVPVVRNQTNMAPPTYTMPRAQANLTAHVSPAAPPDVQPRPCANV